MLSLKCQYHIRNYITNKIILLPKVLVFSFFFGKFYSHNTEQFFFTEIQLRHSFNERLAHKKRKEKNKNIVRFLRPNLYLVFSLRVRLLCNE